MIFDTHAHYDDEQFNEDRVELLNSMEEQGVGTIVNVSAAYNSCRKVIAHPSAPRKYRRNHYRH